MLYEFQQKIKKLSLGKRKFLLNKMNAFITLNEEIWKGNAEKQSSKLLSQQDKVREQFIYGASLLIDERKTLKETSTLMKDTFSVTSAQYEYYITILERYESELTSSGREAFCANVMGTSPSKKIFQRCGIRTNQIPCTTEVVTKTIEQRVGAHLLTPRQKAESKKVVQEREAGKKFLAISAKMRQDIQH